MFVLGNNLTYSAESRASSDKVGRLVKKNIGTGTSTLPNKDKKKFGTQYLNHLFI